jgi:hypothetical protein
VYPKSPAKFGIIIGPGPPIVHVQGVAWKVCCLNRAEGGLNFIDPEDALTALMTKWVISACEPGRSNFKVLLRYRLAAFQPHVQGS